MAEDDIEYHDYIWDKNEDTVGIARGLASFLTEIGDVENAGKITLSSGEDNMVLVPYGNENLGMYISYGTSDSSYPYLGVAYKKSDGTWASNTSYRIDPITNRNTYGYIGSRIIVKKIGDITSYSIHTISSKSVTLNGNREFFSVPMTDYFTSESREGLYFKVASSNYGFIGYNEDSKNVITLYEDPIGGTVYPNRNQTVAAPILFKDGATNPYYYCHAGSPTSLYKIYSGNIPIGIGLNAKIKINGVTFQQIIKDYFIRL